MEISPDSRRSARASGVLSSAHEESLIAAAEDGERWNSNSHHRAPSLHQVRLHRINSLMRRPMRVS